MDIHVWLWILGAGLTLSIAVLGWVGRCLSKLGDEVSTLKSERDRLFDEVGRDHDKGLRGRMHKVENILSPSFLRWQQDKERNER